MTMFNSTFAQDSGAIEYPENGTDPVATYTAVDPRGQVDCLVVGGNDGRLLNSERDGVLRFKSAPDYEDCRRRLATLQR